jgi:decaprenyl-phosphate phosphoribosyltransferase
MLHLIIQEMRVKSWTKNFLIFLPALAASEYSKLYSIQLWLLFLAFCLFSSSVYVLNDIRDVDFDKSHPEKSYRPIANGKISEFQGIALIVLCVCFALFVISFLSLATKISVFLFLILNLFYSFGLKSKPILELFLVSSGYLIRCASGAFEAQVELSFWFYIIVGFCSLSLITGKRIAESTQDIEMKRIVLKAYSTDFLKTLYGIAVCSSINFTFLWINEKFGNEPKNILAGALLTIALLAHVRVTLSEDAREVEFPELWLRSKPHLIAAVFLAGIILYA